MITEETMKDKKESYTMIEDNRFIIFFVGCFVSGIFLILKASGSLDWKYWVLFLPMLISFGFSVIIAISHFFWNLKHGGPL